MYLLNRIKRSQEKELALIFQGTDLFPGQSMQNRIFRLKESVKNYYEDNHLKYLNLQYVLNKKGEFILVITLEGKKITYLVPQD